VRVGHKQVSKRHQSCIERAVGRQDPHTGPAVWNASKFAQQAETAVCLGVAGHPANSLHHLPNLAQLTHVCSTAVESTSHVKTRLQSCAESINSSINNREPWRARYAGTQFDNPRTRLLDPRCCYDASSFDQLLAKKTILDESGKITAAPAAQRSKQAETGDGRSCCWLNSDRY